ncbi:MAG: amidophosphoribosyltransferase, partial [Alistipes sp.]|nr:amidophosphoribosyltransferase [Alistipes sp.]
VCRRFVKLEVKSRGSTLDSCAFMILTDSGIYAVRDKLGRTPVIVGNSREGYAVATENSAFINLGYLTNMELGPSQAVFVTPDGVEEVLPAGKKMQICSFMWVYYGYPSSYYEGINVEDARYRCGCALAMRDGELEGADLVAGIPDSGVGHAIGYSNRRKIPYKRAFVKYTPTWPRSFMPQSQGMRDLVAKMKLLPNEALVRGANMVLLDDSIVRGTQLKDNICKLADAGGGKVHIRIACPPLVYPCVYLNFSTSRSTFDLITRRIIKELEGTDQFTEELLARYADPDSPQYARLVEALRHRIGADTLRFQRLDDLVRAIGLPKESLCTHCWDNSSWM